jgi:tripartite-type tricarboxylate transporter receptor subunit TctC
MTATAVALGLGAAAGLTATGAVWAQGSYPAKPVRVIVPFAAGGGADITARVLGQKFSEAWGQPVVIDNRPGASGNIGHEQVARAPADGHTLLMTSSAFAINPSLYARMPYDPVRDFTPILRPVVLPNILVVHPSLPVKSVQELAEFARRRPGQIAYASAGAGTGTHIAAEMFKQMAGVDLVHVPYKGGGAVLNDLLGGQIALTFATMPTVLPQVQAGKLRALAMASEKRSPSLPQLPTVAESGYPGFEVSTWIAFFGPAGLAREAAARVHSESLRALRLPDVQERFSGLGMEIVGDTPEQFAAYVRTELAKYAGVVKKGGIRLE